jgi:hypothetical protein
MPVKFHCSQYGIYSMKLCPIAAIYDITPSLVWLKFDFEHPCGLPKVLQNVTLVPRFSALSEYVRVNIWFRIRREISWLVEWLPATSFQEGLRVFTSWSYMMIWHVTFPQASCSIYYCCLKYTGYVVMNGRVIVSDYLGMW